MTRHLLRDYNQEHWFDKLADLPPAVNGLKYRAHFVALLGCVAVGDKVTRLQLYDGTRNVHNHNAIRDPVSLESGGEDLKDSLFQVSVFNERWLRFVSDLMEYRNLLHFDGFNHFGRGIFVEVSCQVKEYGNRPVDCMIDRTCTLEFLDQGLNNVQWDKRPALQRIIGCLPQGFLKSNVTNFSRTVPHEKLSAVVNGTFYRDPRRATPVTTRPPAQTTQPAPRPNTSVADSFESFDEEEEEEEEEADQPSRHKHRTPSSLPTPPRKKSRNAHTIGDLNRVDPEDSQEYEVDAVVSCTRPQGYGLDSGMPWLILCLMERADEDEDHLTNQSMLEVLIEGEEEVLAFFGVRDLEELEACKECLVEELRTVVDLEALHSFKLKRAKYPVSEGLQMACWKSVGLTMRDLTKN